MTTNREITSFTVHLVHIFYDFLETSTIKKMPKTQRWRTGHPPHRIKLKLVTPISEKNLSTFPDFFKSNLTKYLIKTNGYTSKLEIYEAHPLKLWIIYDQTPILKVL